MAAFLILLLTLSWAQALTKAHAPPGLTIVKYKWQRIGSGPAVDTTFKAESDSPIGSTGDPNVSTPTSGSRDRETSYFLYTLELRNDGGKSIRAVLWDYLIVDSKTSEELGRHQFVSFDRVGRGTAKTLTVKSRLLPSQLVTVEGAPPNTNVAVVERVTLKCVVYDDGTVWQQSPEWAQACETVRKRSVN